MVKSGARLPRPAGGVRLGTWNIRWFPDGRPGKRPKGTGTDIAWLACAITWLDVDALAVQEMKTTERARERSRELLRELSVLTGATWRIALDPCQVVSGQHVGFVWNTRSLTASEPVLLPSLNPHGTPCKDLLRPGLGIHLRAKSGLDFHFVSVHLKSGTKRRDLDLRQRSLGGLAAAMQLLQQDHADPDVVIAGDFNTMGCRHCKPPVSSSAELSALDAVLERGASGRARISTDAACSEGYGAHGALLDHFVASKSLDASHLESRVSGFCADSACRFPSKVKLPAKGSLSDHCPVVLDLPAPKAGD